MSTRPQKVAMAIQEEISRIILYELKDPRIGFVTITHVDLTDDLKVAHVFYSVMEDPKKTAASEQGLLAARGFIRRLLGKRLKLRFVPELQFRRHDSIRQSFHITELLRELDERKKEDEG